MLFTPFWCPPSRRAVKVVFHKAVHDMVAGFGLLFLLSIPSP